MAKSLSLSLSLPPSSLSVFHSQSSAYWENCKFELGSFLVFFVPRLESRVVVNARSLGHFFETCSFSVEAEEGARSRGEEGAEKQEQGNLSVVYFSANGPIIKEHREYRQTELQCSATVDWEWEEGTAGRR